ncbi:YncE family protein [Rufibacter glacialis]|uniref:YncE family protein n=1 Tax=Rufibacter glacialis TaxID=1259555 RepID=A0A5M8QM92_9BACT|nr:DUF5074 domain-containing protein [Rufibacter glacialis]KAA6437265.1 hypothetical protein FOE74_01845 [Rufibacter glacialis]GGK60585.1 hypothetical protein GCM10011405_06030 [Rufibacter glacialis]
MKRSPFAKQVLGSLLVLALPFATSCQEEEKDLVPVYETGVLISNAGTPNSTVSYYDRATQTVEADLFQKANNQSLNGNLVSMAATFEKTYLLTGNQKIEVLHARTFTSAGAIAGLVNPRQLLVKDNKTGYVSDWLPTPASGQADSGRVVEVNLATNKVVKNISVGPNPGRMALLGVRLFIANEKSNKINVLNTTTYKMDTTLTVGHHPNSMVVDASGILWVLCGGMVDAANPANSTKGQLYRINPAALKTAPQVFTFPSSAFRPQGLTLSSSKNQLFFLYDGVYAMNKGATALPAQPLIPRRFSVLGQDPADGLLYAATQPAAAGASAWVIRYKNTGSVVDSFEVQGTPNGFGFR